MKEFLFANWYYLVSILILIASFIVAIVRKKASMNVSDAIKASLSEYIPEFIKVAELTNDSGKNKLEFVIQLGLDKVSSILGVSLSIAQCEYWTAYIKKLTESILETPEKKGLEK